MDERKNVDSLLSNAVYEVSVELIDNCISKLTLGKTAGLDNLTAEHFKYCHPIIVIILTKLFNLMFCFVYVPDDFGVGLMIPIPKGS